MIGFLEGRVRSVHGGFLLLMCGGVGYRLYTPAALLSSAKAGASLALFTHLVVREDVLDLYGFETEAELRFFELLLAVSGVGPRSALAVLDVAPVETLRSAIASGRAEYLTKVSGIGRKKAEKIVVELRDKVGTGDAARTESLRGDEEALEALRQLGYSLEEARGALRDVPASVSGGSARLREALRVLGRSQ